MNDTATFPSLDLYPLHDKDGFIEFVTGMWLHTRELVGPPTVREVAATFPHFSAERRQQLLELLARRHQVAT